MSQAKGTGVVGYNVQVAVDTKHHLIVTHEVTNIGNDRTQLSPMAKAARDAMGKRTIRALADRGYFSAPEIKACDDAGIAALVPKMQTSSAKADGRFDRADFIYIARDDQYLCPAGQRAIYRFSSVERENPMTLRTYWSSACPKCPMKSQCTSADYRRIRRWEHEAVLEKMQSRLDRQLDAMTIRRQSRTCVWNPQVLDGFDPLPDAPFGPCRGGNEFACAGIQPQASHRDSRVRKDHARNEAGRRVNSRADAVHRQSSITSSACVSAQRKRALYRTSPTGRSARFYTASADCGPTRRTVIDPKRSVSPLDNGRSATTDFSFGTGNSGRLACSTTPI